MAYEAFEDSTLRKAFAFTLNADQADATSSPPVIFLAELAEELRAEANAAPDARLLLNADTLERALMSRLSSPPATYPEWTVHYLMACYARAADETRAATMLKEPTDQQRFLDMLTLARQLTVSYTGFIVLMAMFPQPNEAEVRGAAQLLDSMYAAYTSSSASAGFGGSATAGSEVIPMDVIQHTKVTPMPPNFLEDFAFRFKDEGFDETINVLVSTLLMRLSTVSLLGNWEPHIAVLERLVSSKHTAAALVQSALWYPRGRSLDGRDIEFQTLLGAAFGISALPGDIEANAVLNPAVRKPDPVEQLFPNPEVVSNSDLRSATLLLQSSLSQLHDRLHRIIMSLLRTSETKQQTLQWLSSAVHCNEQRTKMQPDYKKASTEGFMLNLSAVMLRLCRPFIDPLQGKAWPRLDPRYPSDPAARGRNFDDDTRLGATQSEVAAWVSASNPGNSSASGTAASGGSAATTDSPPSPSTEYHFICEAFFLTALSLHLGLCKSMERASRTAQHARHILEDAQDLRAPGQPPMAAAQAQMFERIANRLKGVALTFDSIFRGEALINDALNYYRLLAAWLLRLASPSAAQGAPPSLPLPEPAPMEFSSLPEHYVEDLCSIVSYIARGRRDLATPPVMEQFMLFFAVFLGSTAYVKNPYLRAKMVEALHPYLPETDDDGSGGFSARRRRWAGSDQIATLFEVHPVVIGAMVRGCILLYVDIERTDRGSTFYDKFNYRSQIGEILAYLWGLPPHRAAWRQVASTDLHLYVRFINMMINDSQHLLQEALEMLPKVQETERLQEDPARWAALSSAERRQREQDLHQQRRVLRSDFYLAQIYLETMQYTSEDSVVASRFFDLQVRDRQARILNFFLRYLTLPVERVRLRLRKPELYGWHPRELIALLASIHVNLFRADRQAWADAVAADTDYYGNHPEIFTELVGVLRPLGLAPEDQIADLEALATAAAVATAGAAAEEEAFDDVPEEFEDPLSCRLMSDPVKLPSGNILDRGTILQHLLTDLRDPFSRAPMSETDLEEMPELKARIEGWIAEQRAKRKAKAEAADGAAAVAPMQEDS